MIVHFDGEDYEFDLDKIDVTEARFVKRQTGLSLLRFQEGIFESDPDCLVLAYWLMMKWAGKKMQDPAKINFAIGAFASALSDAYLVEAKKREAEELAGPTQDEVPATA